MTPKESSFHETVLALSSTLGRIEGLLGRLEQYPAETQAPEGSEARRILAEIVRDRELVEQIMRRLTETEVRLRVALARTY